MHSFNDKYKDRMPNETIQIIKNFFESRGYELKIVCNAEAESGTWASRLLLLYDNHLILTSNGKGTTEEFSLASCHAELYERFCNQMHCIGNPFIINEVMRINKLKNGYYFNANEKIISYEDSFNLPIMKQFQNTYEDAPNQLKTFFTLICNNEFVGVPFINPFNSSDIKYLDPRIVVRATKSSGMCAGNSFIEAFNQGASEILEHHVTGEHLYCQDKFDTFYALDLKTIKNKELKKLIENIEAAGNKIIVYDFSYLYNIPVLLSVTINKITHASTVNISSFPVFDIALERVITETYQGAPELKLEKTSGQIPFRAEKPVHFDIKWPGSTSTRPAFPEKILLKTKFNCKPNDKIFLMGESYSNIEIFEYFQKISKQLHFNFYVYDCSKTENIVALKIITDNFTTLLVDNMAAKEILNKTASYNFLFNFYNCINNILSGHYDFHNILKLYKNNLSPYERKFTGGLIVNEWWLLRETRDSACSLLLNYIISNIHQLEKNYGLCAKVSQLLFEQNDEEAYILIQKYMLLMRYVALNEYTFEELKVIFAHLGFEITFDDFNNVNNKEYLVKKIIVDPLYADYHSDTFIKYVETLI